MDKIRLRTIVSLLIVGIGVAISATAAEPLDSCFKSLPAGCFVRNSVDLPKDQVAAIGNKLGAAITRISNTFLTVQGQAIQVNILEGNTETDAVALHKTIAGMKSDPAFCLRIGNRVVEYVGNNHALATKTSYELGFVARPGQVRYRVIANVATVDRADYMAFNELFNLFLAARPSDGNQGVPPQIAALSKRFQFGNSITLRAPGTPARADYSFNPTPGDTPKTNAFDTVTCSFARLHISFGVPYVTLTAALTVDDTGFTPTTRKAEKSLLMTTAWWPASDPQVTALANQITSRATSQEAKVEAVLTWLTPGTNIRFGGPVTGSRWGVKKVLQQKYGHCWDFADCFVTLCRASGVPCRQVAGWLYGTSGHVWAEVLIDGKGWQQVDATGGGILKCGIYHIPYFTTEDGEMPVLYVSMPKIDILETR